MIVWIASFPRSGNTFLRIGLRAIYSVKTYSGFRSGDDLVTDLGRADLTGHRKLRGKPSEAGLFRDHKRIQRFLEGLELENEVYFIKTHALPSELCDTKCRAILLVRDGRDAAISFANYMLDTENTWRRFKLLLSSFIKNGDYISASRVQHVLIKLFRASGVSLAKQLGLRDKVYNYLLTGFLTKKGPYGRWTSMNSEWIGRKYGQTCVIKFEDLIVHPQDCIRDALNQLGINICEHKGKIPTFAELQKLHPKFFRSGRLREWENSIDEELNEKFWVVHGSMMSRLGYMKSRIGP